MQTQYSLSVTKQTLTKNNEHFPAHRNHYLKKFFLPVKIAQK